MDDFLLKYPFFYRLYQNIVGANKLRFILAKGYIKAREKDVLLDIGCGTADIIKFLPKIKYFGFDMNSKYIEYARSVYGKKGVFICKDVNKYSIENNKYNIIIAIGILHHLNNQEAQKLFDLSKYALKKNGKLITVDGCYANDQSKLVHFLLSIDRGKFVRTKKAYLKLASTYFNKIKTTFRNDLIKIPSNILIMECR